MAFKGGNEVIFKRWVGDNGKSGIEAGTLLSQFFKIPVGRQCDYPETAGVPVDNVKRILADGARRAENRDVFAVHSTSAR